jgi:hypothetical protein
MGPTTMTFEKLASPVAIGSLVGTKDMAHDHGIPFADT